MKWCNLAGIFTIHFAVFWNRTTTTNITVYYFFRIDTRKKQHSTGAQCLNLTRVISLFSFNNETDSRFMRKIPFVKSVDCDVEVLYQKFLSNLRRSPSAIPENVASISSNSTQYETDFEPITNNSICKLDSDSSLSAKIYHQQHQTAHRRLDVRLVIFAVQASIVVAFFVFCFWRCGNNSSNSSSSAKQQQQPVFQQQTQQLRHPQPPSWSSNDSSTAAPVLFSSSTQHHTRRNNATQSSH